MSSNSEAGRESFSTDAPDGAGTSGEDESQQFLDGLIALLDLEKLEENLFRGHSPVGETRLRVFGGQVASQALVAAARTVPSDRRVHSLHAYFLRPGDTRVPIIFDVERTRDGKSFTTRRVKAIQHGQTIFALSCSFQVDEPGLDHAISMPEVPPPDSLPTFAERLATTGNPIAEYSSIAKPFDVRYITDPPWQGRIAVPRPGAENRVWCRAAGTLPDDDLLHVCVMAYLSDASLLDSVLANHGVSPIVDKLQMASLDHAMWFHRPFRADEWMLYDTTSPSASGARGLAMGYFFSADGALLSTVVQEGLVRLR